MFSAQTVTIAGRRIGPDQPPYIVAEMSGNHNGDIGRAFRILDAAKGAGADAVVRVAVLEVAGSHLERTGDPVMRARW